MQPYIELVRRAERGDGLYKDFEFLTVCARDWIKRNPVSYPNGSRAFYHHSTTAFLSQRSSDRWPVPEEDDAKYSNNRR
jgi:hypothetical protein